MIQLNPLQNYIDGGPRAAITSPPSASLVFDLPGRAIWVKGVKLIGTDHTYTFSHDNYINLTNTPDPNNNLVEDIKIGININTLKAAIDTTYTTGSLSELQTGTSTSAQVWAAKTIAQYVTGLIPSTKNITINGLTYAIFTTETSLPTFLAPTSLGNAGLVLACTANGFTWVNQTSNTDYQVTQAKVTSNSEFRVLLKKTADDTNETTYVNFPTTLTYNPSTKILKVDGNKVITVADVFTGATSSANGSVGLVPAPTSALRTYFLKGNGTWAAAPSTVDTWRPIKIEGVEKLGSAINTDALDFSAGTGISITYNTTTKKIIITNTAPDLNHDTNTWRPIYLGGTAKQNSTIGSAGMNLKAGSGITVTYLAPGTTGGTTDSGSNDYGTYTINASNQIPADNITGSGTNGWITKWTGEHTIGKLVALSNTVSSQTQSTKFLREDGTWAAPSYTTNSNTWRPVKVEGTEKLGSGINTDALDFAAGNGIEVTYNTTTKKVVIKNTKPDVNHNTDRTGIIKSTVSGTKKTDTTLIVANTSSGLIFEGGTNLFKIGDGTNYVEIPVTPSFTVTDKSANILTSLTTLATIAGTDIKAKVTVVDSSPTLTTSLQTIATIAGVDIKAKITNYNTDENVKQVDNNNSEWRPILTKNGTGTGTITSTTTFADNVAVYMNGNYLRANLFYTESDDITTTAITRVYCSNDGYIRYKTLAQFTSDIITQAGLTTVTLTKTLTPTTSWGATGIGTTDLATGTYAVQVVQGTHYYSGILSWYAAAGGMAEEIDLHYNGSGTPTRIYLRTNNGLLLIAADAAYSSTSFTFNFRKLI